MRWSDDHGATWSSTVVVTRPHENTQNSQPMIQPDGTITDVYLGPGISLVARTSRDGGATWSHESVVTPVTGFGPAGIRCCLPSSAIDPVTGTMYTVWEGPGVRDPVELSTSSDGEHWTEEHPITHDGLAHITASVTAYGGRVFIDYGTLSPGAHLVQQQLQSSADGGASFGSPLSLGPASNLRWAAVSGGKFPGDYAGIAATANRLTLVWCVSSQPPVAGAKYHQTLYAAELTP